MKTTPFNPKTAVALMVIGLGFDFARSDCIIRARDAAAD
jgi:hypothetical protein